MRDRAAPTGRPAPHRRVATLLSTLLLLVGIAGIFLPQLSCGGSSGRDDVFPPIVFPDPVPLTAAQAEAVIDAAAQAVGSANLHVAVVDRVGRVLGMWHRTGGVPLVGGPTPEEIDDFNRTIAIARTAAFLSSSQGPLTSRTLEFISTHHFPVTFAQAEATRVVLEVDDTIGIYPEQRITTGVGFTPQGPLWQIFSTNRGETLDDPANPYVTSPDDQRYPRPSRYDPTMPFTPADPTDPETGFADFNNSGSGLGYLPGGFPLYDANNRVIGGVGCYIPNLAGRAAGDPLAAPSDQDILAMEFAALNGFSVAPFTALPIKKEGLIFLVGILLPVFEADERPIGVPVGAPAVVGGTPTAGGTFEPVDPNDLNALTRDGIVDPFGWLINPIDDPIGMIDGEATLTANEVTSIINESVITSNNMRAAIRLPIGVPARMFLAISNREGLILGAFRMQDAPIFSNMVSVTKARNVAYFSSQEAVDNGEYLDGNGVNFVDNPPPGPTPGSAGPIALTSRTLTFLTQPFYPPGIDTSVEVPGPAFDTLATFNALPAQFNRQSRQDPAGPWAGRQSGVVFFPGAAPLYRNGVLIGGYGVSGDGVEEDDFVTVGGVVNALHEDGVTRGFEPPQELRADMFFHSGLRLPYHKFPQLPGGGNPGP